MDDWTLVIRQGNKSRRFKSFPVTSRCQIILNSTKQNFNDSDDKISFSNLTKIVTKFKNNFPESFRFVLSIFINILIII
jgi:hypothetical protein